MKQVKTHASRNGSGMLASTLLISEGPKPVKVRLCLGRLKPGPTGPWRSAMGAPTEGLRSRRGEVMVVVESLQLKAVRAVLRNEEDDERNIKWGGGSCQDAKVEDKKEGKSSSSSREQLTTPPPLPFLLLLPFLPLPTFLLSVPPSVRHQQEHHTKFHCFECSSLRPVLF